MQEAYLGIAILAGRSSIRRFTLFAPKCVTRNYKYFSIYALI